MSKTYVIDIDGTICDWQAGRDYTLAEPLTERIEMINKLYDEGNTIVYWTARGSRKQINWEELTRQQLDSWGAKYHELKVDKPFYDLFIEDKALRIEEL